MLFIKIRQTLLEDALVRAVNADPSAHTQGMNCKVFQVLSPSMLQHRQLQAYLNKEWEVRVKRISKQLL